jgi:hypothetical protein
MEAHVRSLNQFRRSNTVPLTQEEKRGMIEAELLKDHTRSNESIAVWLSKCAPGSNTGRAWLCWIMQDLVDGLDPFHGLLLTAADGTHHPSVHFAGTQPLDD